MNDREKAEKELAQMKRERMDTEQIMASMRENLSALIKRITALETRLKQAPKGPLFLTDHVILRYAERKYDLDVTRLKAEILEELKGAEKMLNGEYGGFVIKENRVVTFVGSGLKV